jgi:hypothetical protein
VLLVAVAVVGEYKNLVPIFLSGGELFWTLNILKSFRFCDLSNPWHPPKMSQNYIRQEEFLNILLFLLWNILTPNYSRQKCIAKWKWQNIFFENDGLLLNSPVSKL